MLTVGFEQHIIGHILLAGRHERFDDRMASGTDVEREAVVHHGTHIPPLFGQCGKGVVAVEVGERLRVALQLADALCRRLHEGAVDAGFEHDDAVFRAEDFLFVFFEFLRDVALCTDERLLANPFFRHKLLVGVAHLHIVAEHVVETDFQTLDAGALDFAFLHAEQVVLAGALDVPQFVELRIHPMPDDPAFGHQQRRVAAEFALNAGAQFGAGVELLTDGADALLRGSHTDVFENDHRFQCQPQLLHFAWVDASRGHFRDDALQVAHLREFEVTEFAEVRCAEKVLHAVLPLHDVGHGAEGEEKPAP